MLEQRRERLELKYFIRDGEVPALRALIAPFTRLDRHAATCEGGRYVVRSVYFDTPDMRFYWEKEAGVKIRKKLRLRTYNSPADGAPGFVEIKRKYGNIVRKERVQLPVEEAIAVLEGAASPSGLPDLSRASRDSLDRFLALQQLLGLRPTVLVVYEREPYVGRDDPRVRVTFDCDVRSMIHPAIDEIFDQRSLRYVTGRRQVLELKFDGAMPPWLRPLTACLDRSHQAISKYCRGVDIWGPVGRGSWGAARRGAPREYMRAKRAGC
ncbi:MAG: polyphosphate polymerase domain-containing protein [Candidatus Krumholzibacteriota bacterium]|nr:polyphosphate polymerase domain-containing protein [Candidatus Krumholzibacteriota bacterium]